MDSSEALVSGIRGRAEELERFFDRITAGRVAVECPHPRRRQGNLFQDAHVAVRDAFDAVRRLLEDTVREQRGDIKLHTVPDHARCALLPAFREHRRPAGEYRGAGRQTPSRAGRCRSFVNTACKSMPEQ
jgi:hypothetical protein